MSKNFKNFAIYSSVFAIIGTGVVLGSIIGQYVTIQRTREKRKYLKFM